MPVVSRAAAVIALLLCGVVAIVLFVRYPMPTKPHSETATVVENMKLSEQGPSGTSPSTTQIAASIPAPTDHPATDTPTASASDGTAVVSGRILFSGKEPEMAEVPLGNTPDCAKLHKDPVYDDSVIINSDKTLANVVVWIAAGLPAGATYPTPSKPMTLDQRGCLYHPHVNACMAGQEVVVRNSDPFLHNIHALCIDNPAFNFGQPAPSDKKLEPFKSTERFTVKCDVHPWMHSIIQVFDNPFFDVTREKGTFKIAGLPPGPYTLKAWHEKFGEQEKQIDVQAGKPTAIEFTFQPQ